MNVLLRSLIRPLRRHVDQLRALERAMPEGPGCLDELALARVADGYGRPEELAHVSGCPACRAQLVDLHRLLDSAPVVRERDSLDPPRRRTWTRPARWPVVAAAAAVLAVVLLWRGPFIGEVGPDRLRDDPGALRGVAPALLSPRDVAADRPAFRWTSVPEASQYRLTVFDAEGGLIWSAETADTAIVAPSDAELTSGVSYWWRVEARVDFDRWVASDLADFQLR